eukprot:TRINITY_DN561_c1_g1_i1.p1 TRINITY_DN561_c1_g1~~TRINITY_DN561_c1_g1_i1.p1  ORF type:complete len:283 (+),score=83.68 TRINITY_DN561_c1_g1_i1:503-1351(+)
MGNRGERRGRGRGERRGDRRGRWRGERRGGRGREEAPIADRDEEENTNLADSGWASYVQSEIPIRGSEIGSRPIMSGGRQPFASAIVHEAEDNPIVSTEDWSTVVENDEAEKKDKAEKKEESQKDLAMEELAKSMQAMLKIEIEKLKSETHDSKVDMAKKEEEIKQQYEKKLQAEKALSQLAKEKELAKQRVKFERETTIKQIKDIDGYLQTYICPITSEVMREPVTAEDGHTYELLDMEKWRSKNTMSPITRQQIGKKIIPNYKPKLPIIELTEKRHSLEA